MNGDNTGDDNNNNKAIDKDDDDKTTRKNDPKKDGSAHHWDDDMPAATTQRRRRRGMKPRSQRNRKRPRSERLSNEGLEIRSKIVPLPILPSSLLLSSSSSNDDDKNSSNGSRQDETDATTTAPTKASIASSSSSESHNHHNHHNHPRPRLIRVVEPYVYTFASHCKARWIGRTVHDVYTKEFGGYPASYYQSAIPQGRILVSEQRVSLNYVIRSNDVLCHRVHRHEPAVAVTHRDAPYVTIVGETERVVAVDKPATLPVHPCGGYHQNSLMPLLEPTHGKLYTIHRLDRLTSGLCILGKTSQDAQVWGKAIKQREHCQKVYLARVKGKFPNHCKVPKVGDNDDGDNDTTRLPLHGEWATTTATAVDSVESVRATQARSQNAYGYWITHGPSAGSVLQDKPLSDLSATKSSTNVEHLLDLLRGARNNNNRQPTQPSDNNNDSTPWLHLSCPVRVAEPIRGVCESGTFGDLDDATYLKTVKPCQTSFAVVEYDPESDSTLVMCRPETGRTHQIRLHLQHLGHPIANDPNYGGDMFFENDAGRLACEQAKQKLGGHDGDDKGKSQKDVLLNSDSPATQEEVHRATTDSKPWDEAKETLNAYIERTCIWCARHNNPILEYLVRSPGIWLHALQYTITNQAASKDKGEGSEEHKFRTPLPEWACFNKLDCR